MLSPFQRVHRQTAMAGGVGRKEHRFDAIILQHFFDRRICFLATTGFGQLGATVGKKVSYGHDLDVWMVLKAEGGPKLTDTVASDTDADFTVGNGFPWFGRMRVGSDLLEALDNFVVSSYRRGGANGGGGNAKGVQEGAAREGHGEECSVFSVRHFLGFISSTCSAMNRYGN